MRSILILLFIISFALPSEAILVRIKDITKVQGLRDYYLTGYGLVAGLPSNSGDRNNVATNLAQINLLENFGINIKDFLVNNQVDVTSLDMRNPGQAAIAALRQINGGAVGNVAAVMITAKVGPYSKEGDKFDVDISSFSTARNLTGGVLLQSLLKGPDGKVYAAAQGPVISSGYEIEANGSLVREGSPNSGRVPKGGMIEFPLPTQIDTSQGLILTTEKVDFATTRKIVDVINKSPLNRQAEIIDGRTVKIVLNGEADNPIVALADVGALKVDAENEAKVVIMERTGTIVVGEDVKLAPVALSHGGISITVRTNNNISQPFVNTLANVNTATDSGTVNSNTGNGSGTGGIVTQSFSNSVIDFNESYTKYVELEESTSLSALVKELNKIGIKAKDMVSIMQALKASGALQAELEII
ncbi:MAG: flagellar basal body P-ring protein FlgI [Candidatus Caenarcaniphilales bacterium]|nr:flagellar basal body P-ring protein FlgI [Candidatus Caenarcaniphilales bacterium]